MHRRCRDPGFTELDLQSGEMACLNCGGQVGKPVLVQAAVQSVREIVTSEEPTKTDIKRVCQQLDAYPQLLTMQVCHTPPRAATRRHAPPRAAARRRAPPPTCARP